MRFFYILPSSIVNINKRCQYRLFSENNSPPLPRPLLISRHFSVLWPQAGLVRLFFIIVVMDHGYFESSAITASIQKGKEKPVMKWSFLTKVENKDLKSFLQALSAFGVDQWAKELGIQDNKLITKLQGKRLTPEPEFPRGRVFANRYR